MLNQSKQKVPEKYSAISEATKVSDFPMSSDITTCGLLRTLAATKLSSKFLELGTGTGLSTSWILDGMDQESSLISVDNDEAYLKIAEQHIGSDSRLSLILSDAGTWIERYKYLKFDYIFADTWHGKYLLLDEVLSMLNRGGLYIIDDMLPQANWPDDHYEKAVKLVNELESKDDILITKQDWATGVIIGVKR